jgi:hypothetical protein
MFEARIPPPRLHRFAVSAFRFSLTPSPERPSDPDARVERADPEVALR